MHLKSLQLHGFKSFAESTEFEFHEGVTGIVGPNGCGKSNIVDGIRWVLGETSAKALRGGEMADVIFNGTDSRKPLGMAEVTLTLADCQEALGVEFNEMAIGRRVFRDGHSEYILNNQVCRLRDIHELLMDTGIGRTSYSIMEQGKIDLLLSSKPEDRRMVFEEAAGITKFKTQKKEALRKLDYTEANLLRLADIITEVKRQMASLQRQASKARRYQTLLQDLKTLDSHLSKKRHEELCAEKAELQGSINSLRHRQGELEGEIETAQKNITAARDAYQSLEFKISESRQKITARQNRVQTAKNRIEFNEEREVELQSLIERNQQDIATTETKVGQQELDLKFADDSISSVEETLSAHRTALEEGIAELEARQQEVRALREEQRQLSEDGTRAESQGLTLGAQLENLRAQSDTDRQRRQQLESELQRLNQEREARKTERDRLLSEISDHQKTMEEHEEELIAAEKGSNRARSELEQLQVSLHELHRRVVEKESRVEVLEQLVSEGEGFLNGTREVLKGLDQPERFQSNVHGVLASYVEADSEYEAAIEAALGRHLQAVLVSGADHAEEIIATLARDKMGEACLIPEEFIPAHGHSQMLALPEGAVAWALDKIRVREHVQPLLRKLLADVLIVPDLHTALRLRNQLGDNTAFATLNGEFVSSVGLIRGGAGSDEQGSILQRQNEIRRLKEESVGFQAELEALRNNSARLDEELSTHLLNLDVTRERLQHTRLTHSTMEGKCSLVDKEIHQFDARTESQDWETQELSKRDEAAEILMEELRSKIEESSARLEQCRVRSTELAESMTRAEAHEKEAEEKVNQLRTELAVEERTCENLRQQRQPMTARMQELVEIVERCRSEIQSYSDRLTSGNQENVNLEKEIEENRASLVSLEEEQNALTLQRSERTSAIEKYETELVQWRRELGKNNEQRGNEEIKTTQLDLRIENLCSIIQQRYQISLENFEPDPHALLTAIESQKKAWRRRRKPAAGNSGDSTGEEEELAGEDQEAPAADRAPEGEAAEAETMENIPGESGPDWDFVREAVTDMKTRLDSMGPVNLEAIEEFEELEERHSFLEGQYQDLVTSKQELLQVIAKINKTTREMFSDTFEKVRGNFQSVFSELFGKGSKADLLLLDESDPLESGIDIVAKPPGKKLQTISLLSGGERSLTAVAMLFAIYMVKPSPFCVLDELDAPLDDANIGRFLKVLDRFINDSQFVIVTHSKRTMSRADVMYGVTMEEYGVSKRVGMKLTSSDKSTPAAAKKKKKTAAAT